MAQVTKRSWPSCGSVEGKRHLADKLIEHKRYINQHGQDMPEIRDWRWGAPSRPAASQQRAEILTKTETRWQYRSP